MKSSLCLGVLALAFCCGNPGDLLGRGSTDAPAKPPATDRAKTDPASPTPSPVEALVFSALMDNVCDVALIELPSRKVRDLGALSDCPRMLTIPGDRGRVMDERGALWTLADKPPIGDGKVIEPPELPRIELQYPDSLDVQYELGRDGIVRARRSWGTGEVTFEEGPSYSGRGEDSWALKAGAWVPADAMGAGPPTGTLGDRGPPTRAATPEEAAHLDEKLGAETCGWVVSTGRPAVAWHVECGEASAYAGPVFVDRGQGWTAVPGTRSDEIEVEQAGRWLLTRYPGLEGKDTVIDLDSSEQVASGNLWFWPEGWAPAGR